MLMELRLRQGLVLWGLLGAGAACALGQGGAQGVSSPAAPGEAKTMVSMPPTPLLPETIGRMVGSGFVRLTGQEIASARFDRAGCAVDSGDPPMVEWKGPCFDVLKEDGVVRLAGADYGSGSGGKVQISSFEFGDATGAYSAYTFYRTMMHGPRVAGGEARLGKLANESTTDGDGTLVWAGTAVVKVTGRLGDADLKMLVGGLPKASGRKGLAPLLPTMIPNEAGGVKVEAASVRYALGPVGYQAMGGVLPAANLGWDKSLEMATAKYAGHGKDGVLTLLLYPTPQIAGDRGRTLEKSINDKGTASFGTVKMRRVGPLVGVTSGELTAAEAEALVQALHLDEIVTFDKKMPLEFHAEVRKTATLLQEIAVFTGVLILAAIVIGVFLGGARAGIRVLRGKSAASEPEFLTIDLRDKPKALFAPKDSERPDPRG